MSSPAGSNQQYAKVTQAVSMEQLSTEEDGQNVGVGRRSWLAPATMAIAFTVGFGIMLAQHFTYSYLDGKAVSDVSASQAWISRISTGLAFAVKVALTISVGAAFVQHQWLQFHREAFRVSEVDALSSALGDLLCLFKSSVWYRQPLLAFIALASWTIPLSAVVTPGSLSVKSSPVITSHRLQVPQPQYSNATHYGNVACCGSASIGQIKEDKRLTRLAANTASSGSPISLQSAFQNETYDLTFNGPAVKCSSANDSIIANMTKDYGIGGGLVTEFVAWVPGGPSRLPPAFSSQGSSLLPTLDQTSLHAAQIFVTTNTGSWNSEVQWVDDTMNYTLRAPKMNVTECVLYNATYNVNFTFTYPNQTRSVEITDWINTVANPPNGQEKAPQDVLSYAAVMSAFGRLLVGYSGYDQYSDNYNTATSWGIINIDWTRAEAVQAGLESLFQNLTLSLMSDSELSKNPSEAEFLPATVESWPVAYVYKPRDLFVANGLSLLAAFVCCAIGMRAFFVNNASYQNVFSTYLRATNDLGLGKYIRDKDTGANPLPRHFAGVRIRMGEQSNESSSYGAPSRQSHSLLVS